MRLRALWLIAVLLICSGVRAEAVPRYVLLDLGTLGGPSADAYGVNNFGNAVGRSRTATGEEHAFLWWNGTGQPAPTVVSAVQAASDAGTLSEAEAGTSPYRHAILRNLGEVILY